MRAYSLVIGLLLLSCNCGLAHEREPRLYRLVRVEDASGRIVLFSANAMNNHASMAGETFISGQHVAFLWRKGRVTILASDGEIAPFVGLGINDRAQVVGHALLTDATGLNTLRGFIWTRGKLTHIGDLPGGSDWSVAYDINNRGQVVGASEAAAGREAVLWEDGALMSLGDLPGGATDANAYAINDRGVVVGQGKTDAGIRPFIWHEGTMKELRTPEATVAALAGDVNNFNVVVGYAWHAGFDIALPLMWHRGRMKQLPLLAPYTSGLPSNINDFGDIVGTSLTFVAPVTSVATLWRRGVPHDLNDLVRDDDPEKPCVTLQFGGGINERGEISVIGSDACRNNAQSVFLLEPLRHKDD